MWDFGFVSIPFMSLAAFAFIIAMMFVLRSEPTYDDDEEAVESPDVSSPDDARTLSAQRSLMSKQPGRPSPKRRPQARKGRTAVAAKTARKGTDPHRVDYRGHRDRGGWRRARFVFPSLKKADGTPFIKGRVGHRL